MMLAARLNVKNGCFDVKDVPVPEPGLGEVLIKVDAAGVCLSDVHLIQGTLKPEHLTSDEVTLGHEVAGIIADNGDGTEEWETGQRVLLQAHEERGGRTYTRGVDYDGGWAEYAVADADTLVQVPDHMPMVQAAIMPDAVSTPWAAVTSTADVRAGQPVAVWGAGGLGAHAIQLLRLVGAAPVIAVDPLAAARERALEFGADAAFDAADLDLIDRVRAETDDVGVRVAFDFAGVSQVRDQAVACLAEEGELVLAGLSREPLTITRATTFSLMRQRILGHHGSTPEHLRQLVEMARRRRLEFSRSVSGQFPLSKAVEVVERLEKKEGNPLRLVLKP